MNDRYFRPFRRSQIDIFAEFVKNQQVLSGSEMEIVSRMEMGCTSLGQWVAKLC